jgi:flagellar M-ring protein FliF
MGVLGVAVDRLGSTARIVVGLIALATVGVIIYIVMSAGGAAYTPAFTNLDARGAGDVQAALAGANIPSQLADGGRTVLVPSSQVDAALVAAGGAGAGSGNAGWSALDHMGLSTTDGQWDMAVLRARSGVLASQIEQIAGIRKATVNLAVPARAIFSTDQSPVTASILIDTGGASLPDTSVRGIVALVAGGVPGLSAQHVTITDERGTPLNSAMSPIGLETADHFAAQRAWEAQQTSIAQAQLDRMLGPGNGTVIVAGTLNFNQVTTRQQQFGNLKGQINSATETENLVTKGATANGAAGSTANLPGAAQQNGASSSTYKHDKGTATNALDTTQTDTVLAAGDPTKMSISLVVSKKALESVLKGASKSAGTQAQALTIIQGAVENAVGFDPANKTNIISASAVEALPNPITALQAAGLNLSAGGAAAADGSALGGLVPAPFGALLQPIGAGVGLLVMLFLVRKSLSRRQALLGSTDASWLPALEAPPIRIEDLMPSLPGPSSAELQAVEKRALQGRVEEIATSRPSDVAAQLRGWLSAES